MHQGVRFEVRNNVAWITMNKPSVLNALSKAMFQDLRLCLEKSTRDPEVYFVVITGEGHAFSTGLNVKEVAELASKSEARFFVFNIVKPFWDTMFRCNKPIISMVNGPAYGAGAEIALASDIVTASGKAVFAFSGGRVGALCCISGLLGPLLMNGRRLVEMNLVGNPVSARTAQNVGLVTFTFPETKLRSGTKRVLKNLLLTSPTSNASFKRVFRSAISRDMLETAYRELFRAISSKGFQEGSRAFAKKTVPAYYS